MPLHLVDLHIHTSVSDGSYSPKEIVDLAKEQGLKAIAITDHDTVGGNKEAVEAGTDRDLEVIPGVEISVEWNKRPIHILGYYIDWENEKLASQLKDLIAFREERNPQIVKKLNLLGLKITYDEVKSVAGEGTVGRPHFAQVLVEKGYVKNEDQAFNKYLKSGASAYVGKKRLSPHEGIHLIKDAGGISVLAHPFTTDGLIDGELEQFIRHFKEWGIEGIEALYPLHTARQTLQLQDLAKKHELLVTGGTDFHGKQKPQLRLGIGFGNMRVPYQAVIEMKKALQKAKS
jgi:predicted metal-dependent phosphoesterase TrpH